MEVLPKVMIIIYIDILSSKNHIKSEWDRVRVEPGPGEVEEDGSVDESINFHLLIYRHTPVKPEVNLRGSRHGVSSGWRTSIEGYYKREVNPTSMDVDLTS